MAPAIANEEAFAATNGVYRLVDVPRKSTSKLPPENDRRAEIREPGPTDVSNQEVPEPPRPVVLQRMAGTPSAILAGPPPAVLEVRQQWEGTVEEVAGDEIVARLRDLTNPGNSDERATFSWDDVADADHSLVSSGAVFYWSIGYERTVFGQKSAKSSIRFRRLPAWTKSEVAAVHREADLLARALGLEA
jgi:hypothetical protein